MKSILISIKPKYVAKILNGEKTIEIRKTMPKSDLPIDVYIYCTKEDNLCCMRKIHKDRYICGKDFDVRDFPQLSSGYEGKGKVVAKFTLNKVEELEFTENHKIKDESFLDNSCLTNDELWKYLKDNLFVWRCIDDKLVFKGGAAWYINNLEIFDKPKKLSEFYRVCNKCPFKNSQVCFDHCGEDICKITKAPQSMCYVEELL